MNEPEDDLSWTAGAEFEKSGVDPNPMLHKLNNPNNEPTGHYTGRCGRCGSSNLWDDNLAYGCNACGAIYA